MSNPLPKVRLLDTPGFADTPGLQQDELYKQSIESGIKNHIDSVNAVLILVNGTIPRVTVGTNYALSTLSAIFSGTPFKKVAFLLTNVSDLLYQNFSADTLSMGFKDAPQFLLNNPIALQRAYLGPRGDPNTRGQWPHLCAVMKASEQDGLEMLVALFDWLDSLNRQGTTEVVKRSQKGEAQEHIPSDSDGPSGRKEGKELFHELFAWHSILIFSFSLRIGYESHSLLNSFKPPWLRRGKKSR
jgi:hypothetical protein